MSERLRELRGTSSQSEMANELNMKQPQWARYESGASVPGADIIEKICRVHKCSADWLLGLKESAPTINATNGSAVAIGRGAKATAFPAPGESPACRSCPHLKKLRKLETIMGK